MNPIRLLREQKGTTQKELAELAGTSQPTVASYESGEKSPTLSTLDRLAKSLGLTAVVTFAPRLSREDERSLAYHEAIVRILKIKPSETILVARRNLDLSRKMNPHASELFDLWSEWLNLPTGELVGKILDPSLASRDMRQVSPFAGILSARDRVRILSNFRKRYQP